MNPLPTVWRWLDLGDLAPLDLHAAYTGLARGMAPDDPPLLLWARPDRPHLSIGASQSLSADVDVPHCTNAGIPVIRRPLGGGTVWLDGDQECFFFILPRTRIPGGHRGLFDLCLDLVAHWFRDTGLPVRRKGGQDLWLGQRKIMGSGAATEGEALVFGASVLRHFPIRRFADCIRAPTPGFRDWLADALAEGMTDWRAQGLDPETALLQAGLRETCARRGGWRFEPWAADAHVRAMMDEVRTELADALDETGGCRHVPDGIRINGLRYLLEQDSGGDWLRVVLDDGVVRRAAARDRADDAALQDCLGEPAHAGVLEARLAAHLPGARAKALANRIEALHASLSQ